MAVKPPTAAEPNEPGSYLDMPAERQDAAKAVAAAMSAAARKHALTLPLGADVDDFRRELVAAAPASGSSWG